MGREIVVESRLDSVTVYASGALCRRRATVGWAGEAPTGTRVRRVRLAGLPVAAEGASMRARAVTAGFRVTDVRRELRAEPQTPEHLAELKRAVDVAEEAYDAARGRRDRLAARVDATASLRAAPPAPRRGDPPRPAPVGAFLALAEFVDTRLAGLHTRLLDAEDAVARASHELDLARNRLAEASHALPTETTRTTADVVVTVTGEAAAGGGPESTATATATASASATATELELELEYVVPGATWFPAYQLRLSRSANAAGSLALRASVAQRTGEDWTGVRLSLSTADLLRRPSLPELRSIRLGRRQEEAPAPLWREPPTGTAALFGGYDDAGARPVAVKAAPVAVAASAAFRDEAAFGGSADGAWAGEPWAHESPAGEERTRGLGAGPRRRAAPRAAAPRAVAYGGPPPPAPGAMPQAPAALMGAAPPPPPLGGPGGPLAVPAPPQPDPALQDYAGLVLAGPDADPAARGRLAPEGGDRQPPREAEYRRRAVAVGGLALPPHAVPVRHTPGSFAYRFDAAAPVDVPADGRWHSVPVEDFPVGLTPWHLCVPALDPAVYAAVELANTSPHALLAGPADILVDGEYTATVAMPALAPGQTRRVGIGVEEGVRVARRVRTAESTSTGLRGATTVVAQTVEIEVANRLGRDISLELLERVPVSDDKEVRIEDGPATPPWTVVPAEEDEERRRGLRRWRVVVEAGGSTTLTAGHQIRLPAGKAVVGGNRRDV